MMGAGRQRRLFGLALAAAVMLSACGGGDKSPSSPSDNNKNGGGGSNCSVTVSVLGCPKGLIRATLDGQTLNGGVAAGGAIYTPIAANTALNLPSQDFIVVVGTTSTNAVISLTTRAKVRTTGVGQNALDPDINNVSVNAISVVIPNGAAVAPGWACNVAGGTGTLTVNTVSTTAATGSFSCTLVPVAGTPSSGNRQLSGTFDVTF